LRLVELVRKFVPVLEREHERAALTARVRVMGNGHEGVGFTRDVGAGELFLHTGEPCRPGELLELAVRMPMRGDDEVRASGRIVRLEGAGDSAGVTGVGVAFERLSARDRIEMTRFVREHTRGVA